MRCKACYAYSSDGGPVKYDDHSRVFDNAAFRTFGLDDGYCFMKTRGELR